MDPSNESQVETQTSHKKTSRLETKIGRLINLHYGRLLATKEELLDEWREEFLQYEVNRIEEKAVMTRGYAELIANV